MLNKLSLPIVLAAATFMAAPAAAQNADSASSSYAVQVSGFVPVICRASTDAAVIAPQQNGAVQLGELKEFCNSGGGYKVYADYSPELESATLVVDGKALPLSSDGTTLVTSSDRAAVASRPVSLELKSGQTSGTISFRIVVAEI